jgi:hypothetical protein
VRHLRMLGLCLVATVALCAMTASQAMAKKEACTQYGEYCETLKEHANIAAMGNCPYEETGVVECFWARTLPSKTEPSYFTAGKITVDLKTPITLQGGGVSDGENQFAFAAPVGAPVITPSPQPTIPLTKAVNTALLSPSELTRYTYFSKIVKENKTTATVEEAGPVNQLVVNLSNLLSEEGAAFTFPVKVHLSNPFVGENCYVGSNEHPIIVKFTDGIVNEELRGSEGEFSELSHFIVWIQENKLASFPFEVPGVEGCGVDGGADAAIDSAIGLPSASGNVSVLHGELKSATAKAEREAEHGER